MPRPKEWNPKELEFLRYNYGKIGAVGCSEKLGRPIQAVRVKAWRMGFKGKGCSIQWTEQMDKLVRDHYPTMFSKPLAKWIGVSHRSLIRRARKLGVAKPDDFLERRRYDIGKMAGSKGPNRGTFRKGSEAGKETRFKPGHQLSPESKKKLSESLKKYWARRKKYESLGLDWRT